MDKNDEQIIKDFIFQAVQSGKKETSDLVGDIMFKMDKRIGEAVEKHVNGKIGKMTQKIDDYIVDDLQWKDSVTPSIERMKDMQRFASVGGWVLKGVVLMGAVFTAIYSFFKVIK